MNTDKAAVPAVEGQIVPSAPALRPLVGDWTVKVHCPYCGGEHTHAAPRGPDVDPGFRMAHCRQDRQGYRIVSLADISSPQPPAAEPSHTPH